MTRARRLPTAETGYMGTTAAILSGTNGSTGKDYNGRALTKAVNTGWAPAKRGLPATSSPCGAWRTWDSEKD